MQRLVRRLQAEPNVRLVGRYLDDGVSGTVPLRQRPGGRQLLQDGADGRFDEVWVYRLDRLGRDDIDPLVVRRDLENLGVEVWSVVEGHPDTFTYAILVAVAAQERRSFLERSSAGMNRAAREGRYTGGVVAFGFRVEGKKSNGHLVPDETPFWSDRSAADLVRWIYHLLAVERWSCRRVAEQLNALGVPTASRREGPGSRAIHTEPRWRAGRVRNLVVNPTYRGEYRFGSRSARRAADEIVVGLVPRLVSDELWYAAQETLAANRIMPKNTKRHYLLRSVMRCGTCGLTYVGTTNRDKVWYRCNGHFRERGEGDTRCTSPDLDGSTIEPLIWSDIERFLRAPGELLGDLSAELEEPPQATDEAERITLERQLMELSAQEDRAIDLNIRGVLAIDKLQERLDQLASQRAEAERRLTVLTPPEAKEEWVAAVPADLAARLSARLDRGLTPAERREIVALLVKRIDVTFAVEAGKRRARLTVEYRFAPSTGTNVVVTTPNDAPAGTTATPNGPAPAPRPPSRATSAGSRGRSSTVSTCSSMCRASSMRS